MPEHGRFFGGAAGSTAGGVKVLRVMLPIRQAMRELHRMVHPRAVSPLRIDGRTVNERVVAGVWGFFALYAFSTSLITMLLAGTGLDTQRPLSPPWPPASTSWVQASASSLPT